MCKRYYAAYVYGKMPHMAWTDRSMPNIFACNRRLVLTAEDKRLSLRDISAAFPEPSFTVGSAPPPAHGVGLRSRRARQGAGYAGLGSADRTVLNNW